MRVFIIDHSDHTKAEEIAEQIKRRVSPSAIVVSEGAIVDTDTVEDTSLQVINTEPSKKSFWKKLLSGFK